jgi:sugar phosphate isomerase/epimerase
MLLTEEPREPDALAEAYNALLDAHLRSLAGKVYHLHLHDTQVEGVRDHRECGTGIIDFTAIFSLLLAADYEGFMTFELEEPDARAALSRSRDVVAAAIRSAAGE